VSRGHLNDSDWHLAAEAEWLQSERSHEGIDEDEDFAPSWLDPIPEWSFQTTDGVEAEEVLSGAWLSPYLGPHIAYLVCPECSMRLGLATPRVIHNRRDGTSRTRLRLLIWSRYRGQRNRRKGKPLLRVTEGFVPEDGDVSLRCPQHGPAQIDSSDIRDAIARSEDRRKPTRLAVELGPIAP
jgi:hypothetical protein